MKRLIRFHKAFAFTAALSGALILSGVVGLFVRGFNMGVDFQPGVNQYVQLAIPAADLGYGGGGTAVLTLSDSTATVVFTGADVESRTRTWNLRTVGTLADLAAQMAPEGLSLTVKDGAGLSADLLVPTYQGDISLSATPALLHRLPKDANERFGSIDEVRKAVSVLGSESVQNVGGEGSLQYIVRIRDDGSDKDFSATLSQAIKTALEGQFGAGHVVTMKTDYVGARFSQDLAGSVWKLTLATLAAILIYATVRFKIQYALGAVLAILHDGLMMVAFIIWTRMEFTSLSIAAILTILGYSINDTIVIFDRIREDHRLNPTDSITTIMDRAITETLGRTFITTITTMLTVVALFAFTTGGIHDFALALFVGMLSGTYSTIFIASGFVGLWDKIKQRLQKAKAQAKPEVAKVTAPTKAPRTPKTAKA